MENLGDKQSSFPDYACSGRYDSGTQCHIAILGEFSNTHMKHLFLWVTTRWLLTTFQGTQIRRPYKHTVTTWDFFCILTEYVSLHESSES